MKAGLRVGTLGLGAKPAIDRNTAFASMPCLWATVGHHDGHQDAVDGDSDCGSCTHGIDGPSRSASEGSKVAAQADIEDVGMTIRTTESSVNFQRPFALLGDERMYPAGAYRVVTDEELIDGLSFLAYRRVSTMMFAPGPALGGSSIEMIAVDPADLAAAQLRDVAEAGPQVIGSDL